MSLLMIMMMTNNDEAFVNYLIINIVIMLRN